MYAIRSYYGLTDVSDGSTSRKWYIDGVEVGNGASSFVHTFAQAGTYTVKLDAVGADWTDSANLQVVVKDTGVLFSVFEFGIADDNVITSYSIHYTKLYDSSGRRSNRWDSR